MRILLMCNSLLKIRARIFCSHLLVRGPRKSVTLAHSEDRDLVLVLRNGTDKNVRFVENLFTHSE